MDKTIIVVPNEELRIAVVAIRNEEIVGLVTGFSIFDEAIMHIEKGESQKVLSAGSIGDLLSNEFDFKVCLVNPFKLYNKRKSIFIGTHLNALKHGKKVWTYKIVSEDIKTLEDLKQE